MTTKKLPGQLPTDCGRVPRLLYSVDEVAQMFGKAPSTIRMACFEHKLPYRLETTWGPGGRRFRRMVFSMREISVLLDHYAPPSTRCWMPPQRVGPGQLPMVLRTLMFVAHLARETARSPARYAGRARRDLIEITEMRTSSAGPDALKPIF
jgi:hypothetical protein